MRAVEIFQLSGPGSATRLADLPEPAAGDGIVVVDVKAAGVSFPEVLQTRGEYQYKPELPFVPGSEVCGVVRSAPDGSGFVPGDKVVAFCMSGAFAEVVAAPLVMTFPLPDGLDFAQGAALILNYHTAYFALVTRGRLNAGETVLIHGAAGGVGTATIQVAKGLGARTIAVVSTTEKATVAKDAGADDVVRSDGAWKDEVLALTGGKGVDIVIDPVGGDRFTDSLRSLNREGRLVVVGFTGGAIPEVKVNRLLLRNTEVVGAGWGEYVISSGLTYGAEVAAEIAKLAAAGHINPPVGARFPLERASEALALLDDRQATGKVVLEM
ncbi:MAG TPA: NADPH:quinone oxidoreductase family protein [Mycobacteriales bacterium]|jgi:NADPH2:quinone reductase|nr:NADPH:quinone oxidoreductase family protein [Mycobacteriales bacterium]